MQKGGTAGTTRPTPSENWLLGKAALSGEGPGGPGVPAAGNRGVLQVQEPKSALFTRLLYL